MRRFLTCCCTAVLGCAMAAQSVVVPNANANTRGTSQLNSIIRNAANPRTYQYGINAAELAGMPVGSVITGVSLRFMVFGSNTASWPAADIPWTTYDIYAGPAIPTASWVADPMLNFAAPPAVVRTGPMTLEANSFTNTNPPAPLPNAWSEFYFDFQTPYLYLGGDVALLFSHPGSTSTLTALYPEVVASSAATHGVARVQSVYPTGVATTVSTFYVMRIHYGYGFGCPGTSGTAPVLVQNGNTEGGLGGTIRLQIGNAPAATLAVLVCGLGAAGTPLPNGCSLLVNPVSTLFLITDSLGRAAYSMSIPPAIQAAFNAQGGVLDSGAPGGYTVTNGVSPMAN